MPKLFASTRAITRSAHSINSGESKKIYRGTPYVPLNKYKSRFRHVCNITKQIRGMPISAPALCDADVGWLASAPSAMLASASPRMSINNVIPTSSGHRLQESLAKLPPTTHHLLSLGLPDFEPRCLPDNAFQLLLPQKPARNAEGSEGRWLRSRARADGYAAEGD